MILYVITTGFAFWTGVVSWTVCSLYTIFGRWYASLTGWVMFSLPFQFGLISLYIALRRAEILDNEDALWVGFIIFFLAAVSITAFLVLLIREAKLIPIFKNMLASMTPDR